MLMAADKHVSLLIDNLRPPITLLLETPDFHHRQFDPVLKCPDTVLIFLQHKDGYLSHVILAAGRSKLATHVKQCAYSDRMYRNVSTTVSTRLDLSVPTVTVCGVTGLQNWFLPRTRRQSQEAEMW